MSNENLNLVEILKDCPEGTKLYSTIYGKVEFDKIYKDKYYPISIKVNPTFFAKVTSDGRHVSHFDGECTLFPSKEQRDWSKFNPQTKQTKQTKFDPKTLQTFDKVLVRDINSSKWKIQLFSHFIERDVDYSCVCITNPYRYCIPFNDDTKHLLDTNEEAPEFYRYWED